MCGKAQGAIRCGLAPTCMCSHGCTCECSCIIIWLMWARMRVMRVARFTLRNVQCRHVWVPERVCAPEPSFMHVSVFVCVCFLQQCTSPVLTSQVSQEG